MTEKEKYELAIKRLADKVEFGNLLSCTIGYELLNAACDRIEELERVVSSPVHNRVSKGGGSGAERDVKNLGGECKWTPTHDDYNTFDTDCGQSFCLDADSPKDNNMKFCCYCGKSLVEG